MGDRYRDRIGSKQDWAVVGVLLLLASIPILAVSAMAIMFGALRWALGVEAGALLVFIACLFLLLALIRFVRRRLL